VVDEVLGVLGIAVFIVCVIALAATVTWLVVRISPKPGAKQRKAAAAAEAAETPTT
jgi:cytochrome c-type biogenesis protein CcmH/NrfG